MSEVFGVTPWVDGAVSTGPLSAQEQDRLDVAARRGDIVTAKTNPLTGGNVIVGPDGSLIALAEVTPYVNVTATTTAIAGPCEFAGYVCTSAAGTITVYDGTSAAGAIIVPTTTLAVGAFPILGAGTSAKLALSTGCHVVLSGAAVVNVLVG